MIFLYAMEKKQKLRRIACFITAHGFGHASRACAFMQSILDNDPAIRFEVFTCTPKWFFRKSLSAEIGYHHLETDIGMVQSSPFQENITATLNKLRRFLPFDLGLITSTVDAVKQLRCEIVLCDISPMGIAVADAAGIPSVLVENFTWDWIYSDYQSESQQFEPYIDYLKKIFNRATYHIKAKPFCQSGKSDLTVAPISRKPRSQASEIRARLRKGNNDKIVILTMGGVKESKDYAVGLEGLNDIHFIIPGVKNEHHQCANLTFLPFQSDFFHPDLINAADAVIGKVGYSTIAEVYQAGKPFGYVKRPTFRESIVLVKFIKDRLPSLPISEEELYSGNWVKKIPKLINMPTEKNLQKNGADAISEFVLARLQSRHIMTS